MSFATQMSHADTKKEERNYKTNSDGFIIDCVEQGNLIECQISKDPIHKNNFMLIYKQAYDVNSLNKLLTFNYNRKRIATIPHNRAPFTEEILQDINNKLNTLNNALDALNVFNPAFNEFFDYESNTLNTLHSKKSGIIIEIINLLKFSKEKQEYIFYLEEEKRKKILSLEDYKYDILTRFSEDEIDHLINNYYYLLNNDNSEEIIKLAIQNEGTSIKFVPSEKLTDEIIIQAITNDSYVLGYLPYEKLTEEIIKLAVIKCGYVLDYVPDEKMTEEIIKLAIINDPDAFELVPTDMQTEKIKKLALDYGYVSEE
jgi:hypothetical protein